LEALRAKVPRPLGTRPRHKGLVRATSRGDVDCRIVDLAQLCRCSVIPEVLAQAVEAPL
jgi:hypothetical protein